ncbi:pollen receptor-like kinase 4 [Rosa sericea]
MGAHMAMARLMRAPNPSFLLALIVAALSFMNMLSFGLPDTTSDALLKFKSSLGNSSKALRNWGSSPNPCNGNTGNWVGVLCFQGKVKGLKLEGMGLQGTLDVEPLASLPYLKTLSFMNNSFIGPLPSLSRLKRLGSVYLSSNHLSGDIPDDAFEGLYFLKKLYLGNNEFSGKIPSSLAKLPKLYDVGLQNNYFSGEIPDFKSELWNLDVTNNELEGEIPKSLRAQEPSSFAGNENLCGPPIEACSLSLAPAPAPTPASSPSPSTPPCGGSGEPCGPPDPPRKSTSLGLKIALGIVSILLLLVIIAVLLMFLKKRKQQPELDQAELLDESSKYTAATASQMDAKSVETNNVNNPPRRGEQAGKLSFVRDDRDRFDLHDLLRASAEILGSGNFGASYKALILTDAVVVKRYKQMNNVGREEFHDHMRRLGRLTHQNLLPIVAYYYRREEKLLVSDFVENGSLASHLHGNHNLHTPGLDWPTRLRIIKGIGRGLTYLYNTLPSLVVPHGHLKSSNVLLDENMEPLLNDYALLPVINMEQAQHLMMAYKSPEYAQHHRITKKTDVWCFGIIMLEVLTGKFPENYLKQSYDSKADLASWVNGMIKEKKTSEVFDGEMGNVGNSKGELLKLLKIGVSCCEEDVERRLDLHEVVAKIEELNEGESDGEYRSSVSSEEDDYTSQAV